MKDVVSIAENRDCMEAMAEFPDKFFDLAIVDPPYGIGDFRAGPGSRKAHKKIEWNNSIPDAAYFNELIRVSNNRIIWGVNYYSKHINDVGRIVHDKTGGGRARIPKELSTCDIASHSFGVNMKIFHYVLAGNIIGNKVDFHGLNKWHPCQKPIALYKWLLKNYGNGGAKYLIHTWGQEAAESRHTIWDLTSMATRSTRTISRRRRNDLNSTRHN